VAKTIGDDLTLLDTTLQSGNLSDADWQTLYAQRKHLDDQQRDIISKSLSQEDAEYQQATTSLKDASAELAKTIGDLTKVSKIISTVSQIASYADKILNKLA
jgi:hypothetical protein